MACNSLKLNGRRCRNWAMHESDLCFVHEQSRKMTLSKKNKKSKNTQVKKSIKAVAKKPYESSDSESEKPVPRITRSQNQVRLKATNPEQSPVRSPVRSPTRNREQSPVRSPARNREQSPVRSPARVNHVKSTHEMQLKTQNLNDRLQNNSPKKVKSPHFDDLISPLTESSTESIADTIVMNSSQKRQFKKTSEILRNQILAIASPMPTLGSRNASPVRVNPTSSVKKNLFEKAKLSASPDRKNIASPTNKSIVELSSPAKKQYPVNPFGVGASSPQRAESKGESNVESNVESKGRKLITPPRPLQKAVILKSNIDDWY